MQLPLTHEHRDRLRDRAVYKFEKFPGEEFVLIDPGLGATTYLSLTGYVALHDDAIWDEYTEPTIITELREFAASIVVGAKKIKMPELLELLPQKPPNGQLCLTCDGTRLWKNHAPTGLKDAVICPECAGLGWVVKD